jgi:hypothetical protein
MGQVKEMKVLYQKSAPYFLQINRPFENTGRNGAPVRRSPPGNKISME